MLLQLKLLKNVLNDLKINNTIEDNNGNLLKMIVGDKCHYFINSQTPFNSQDVVAITKDKEFTYCILKSLINSPITKGYLDPACNERYSQYLEFNNLESIIAHIENNFKMPVILKPNKGARGIGVTLCTNSEEIGKALKAIYDEKSKEYDYIALCQEYINIKKEYRVVCVNKKVELVYLKDNSSATYTGNLSPLHWENSQAVHIQDSTILNRFQEFINPVFKNLNIFWCGFDIALDHNNELHLIEINSNIGLNIFISQNNPTIIENLYKTAIKEFLKIT